MTLDNGKEFAQHQQLAEDLGLDIYFAQPYASWQRGTNENTNRLLRQFFPKGTDFARISRHAVCHYLASVGTSRPLLSNWEFKRNL